ncbi:protein translocase subunit SecD [Canibacter sp. lx-72]|uniref:protein translocase subunit SecD n=1 Tax=Canibacter zhuwentaonis TaxID=2837491 RepID=UPI001BDD432D|nr:protein translocase subunit SecD [Canibacter zhuwentaonis]MBT1017887.1 protein translocase subunit SecD [Canibacter zhuwentaonis]MBT1035050.1 protein translocase subunit SecD [Canibacter zhuwentaonis]
MASSPIVKSARRSLGWFAAIIVVLIGLITLGVTRNEATLVPKLALDLQGGTQILLAPKNVDGANVSSEQVQQAVAIIRQRVDAAGVSEAEVTTQGGSNILVSIPGKADEATLARIEASARLDFRPVLSIGPGQTAPEKPKDNPDTPENEAEAEPEKPAEASGELYPDPLPEGAGDLAWITPKLRQQFLEFQCTTESVAKLSEAPSDRPLITCDGTGVVKYLLGPVELTGDSIADASASVVTTQTGASTGQWGVNLRLNEAGTETFGKISQRLVTQQGPLKQFAFVIDGRVLSAPSMNGTILDGRPQITGGFTQESSEALADQLKYGALPISFQVQSQEDISATLGSNQLQAGLIAGIIGLLVVVLYSIFQYRALASLTVASLLASAIVIYLLLTFFSWRYGYRLSLAGVTGIIVAIGFIADSFIVYFERVRDALRDGFIVDQAVHQGWKRAFRTVLASDAINFLAAAILFAFAIGNVRGFAFTLGLTTLVDIIVVALFTHPMLMLMARTNFWGQGHPASGLNPDMLGAVYKGRARFVSAPAASEKIARRRKTSDKEALRRKTIAERKAALKSKES